MIEMFEHMTGRYAVDASYLKLDNSKTRGHKYKLKKERVRKPVRELFYSNRIVNAWNALPDHVVEAPSVNAFKSRLDKHWQGLQYCIHPVFDAYNLNKSDIDNPRPDTGC